MSIKEWIKSLLEKVFHSPFWEKITDDSDYQRELESIRYGEKSLLTSGGNNQPMYQIIDLGERFLFADVDDWQLITEFEHIPESVFNGKKNLVIAKKDITSVDMGVAYDEQGGETKLLEYVEIRLRWKVQVKGKQGQKNSRRFLSLVLTDEIEEDKLRAFFAGCGRLRLMTDEEFDRLNWHILTGGEVLLKKRLKKAVVGIPIAAVFCIIGVLLPWRGVRNAFIVLGAILPFVLLALDLIFPRYLLIVRNEDFRWDETKWERTIDTSPSLIITAVAQFVLLAVCESRYFPSVEGSVGRWLTLTVVPFVIIVGIMLPVTFSQISGWKERLWSALLCLFFAFFTCLSGVYLLNGALDQSAPVISSGRIEKKWTGRGYKGRTYYCVRTVREDGTKEEFDIFEPEYERVAKGDLITIEQYAGAFGISYQKVIIPD